MKGGVWRWKRRRVRFAGCAVKGSNVLDPSTAIPFFLLLFSFHFTLFLSNFIFTLSSQQWLPFFFAAIGTYLLALCSVRSLHL